MREKEKQTIRIALEAEYRRVENKDFENNYLGGGHGIGYKQFYLNRIREALIALDKIPTETTETD